MMHPYKSDQGSSFKETTRDCLLRFATLTKTTDRQDGAHRGRRTFCSPLKQATGETNVSNQLKKEIQ